MQNIPLKPERKSRRVNFVIEPSLMAKIEEIAEKNDVPLSQVVRHIVTNFLLSDYQKLVVDEQKSKGVVQS
jgi:hypothetical protein